jgi:secernin
MQNEKLPQSCDTMVATPKATLSGQTVFAKNSDRPWDECQPLELHERQSHKSGSTMRTQFLTIPQVETTWRHVGSRPWWCWGYEHGFNEHQVVIGNEAVHSKLESHAEPKLIGMELLRLGLERGRTAREAVDVMTQLITEYGQGKFENDAGVKTYDNSFIVADPTEAYVIETAGHDWAVKQVDSALGISNVYSVETDYQFLSGSAESLARENNWWTSDTRFNFADAFTKESREEGSGAMRRKRSCAVLGKDAGGIGVDTMMSILSDHSDASEPDEPFQTRVQSGGICVHFKQGLGGEITGGNTAASLVADLCNDGSRLAVYWCSFYSPCLSLFFPVFAEATLPPILARGGQHSDDDPESPWWKFHQLNLAAREGGNEAIDAVRREWAGVQEKVMQRAYDLASAGKRTTDAGGSVDRMLTDFVEENVENMLKTVDALLVRLDGEPVGHS